MEKTNENNQMTSDRLAELFAADPRCAQFFLDMAEGKSPWATYIRIFGPELKQGLDDPATVEQIRKAETDYVERVARSRKLDEEYEANMTQTIETLKQFQAERGLSDEQLDAVIASLLGIVRDGIMGKFASETLDMMVKAINHDTDVAAATEQGELTGRNAKITEKMRRRAATDGVVHLAGKNSTASPRHSFSLFDLANEAK